MAVGRLSVCFIAVPVSRILNACGFQLVKRHMCCSDTLLRIAPRAVDFAWHSHRPLPLPVIFPSWPADSVNTGARLAVAAAKQGDRILCSEDVARSTSSAQLGASGLGLLPAGSLTLKGKSVQIGVFRVESCAVAPGRQAAPVSLFGREVETAAARQALSAPGVALVVVEGEPGMGKTALAAALMREAAVQGASARQWVLVAGADEDPVPLAGCRSVLRQLLELHGVPESQAEQLSWLLVRPRPHDRPAARAL